MKDPEIGKDPKSQSLHAEYVERHNALCAKATSEGRHPTEEEELGCLYNDAKKAARAMAIMEFARQYDTTH